MGRSYEFERGYICALSCIVKGHGTGVEVREALQALGLVNWTKIDPYDCEVMHETRMEVERRRKQVPQ